MRRTRARSRSFGLGYRVAKALQTSRDLGKPRRDAGDVFKHDGIGPAGVNEVEPDMGETAALTPQSGPPAMDGGSDAAVLTRRPSGPDDPVAWPAGELAGQGAAADAGEEMALAVSGKVSRSNIDN